MRKAHFVQSKKMKKRIWFIINPISGVRRKDDIPALIRRFLDHNTYTFEIQYTKHKGHAIELVLSGFNARVLRPF